jgi:hypothetical protein
MLHTNVLNRKLEDVYGVGREFTTVADLWGVSHHHYPSDRADCLAIQCPDTCSAGTTG